MLLVNFAEAIFHISSELCMGTSIPCLSISTSAKYKCSQLLYHIDFRPILEFSISDIIDVDALTKKVTNPFNSLSFLPNIGLIVKFEVVDIFYELRS